jgi:transcriptional regulator of acetoin/glycerol metabolism
VSVVDAKTFARCGKIERMRGGAVDAGLLEDPLASARALRRRWDEARESEVVAPGLRPAIAQSWQRSQTLGVYRDRWVADEAPADFDAESGGRRTFLHAAKRVVERLACDLEGSGSVIALFDADCRILARHGDRRVLLRTAEQNFLEGVVWAERDCGTNAVGTAAELGAAVQVFSAEHFCAGWHDYVCSATPVHHPITGQLLGLLDVTAPAAALNAHMFPLVLGMGAEIERLMAAELAAATHRLLARHVGERGAAALVVDAGGRAVRIAAREGLSREDLTTMQAVARDVLAGSEVAAERVRAGPVEVDGAPVGAIVSLDAERRRRAARPVPVTRFGMIGEAPVLADALRRAERVAAADVPVLVTGEAGTGKTHLARRMAGLLAVEVDGHDPGCVCRVMQQDPLAGAVLIEQVDALPASDQQRLARLLDHPHSPRVIAVARSRTPVLQIELGTRLQAGTIVLPALRERRGDIESLIAFWLADRARSAHTVPRLTREARAELRRRSWPGNVAELFSLLDAAAFNATGAVIGAAELPPPLAPAAPAAPVRIVDLERDAIVRAMDATSGDVGAAAELLGISLSTLYRRMRA